MTKRLMLLLLLALPMTGCKAVNAPAPATAPGYYNAPDQQMGEILAGARSFYTSIQTQSANGTMTLTAAEKQAFNTFGNGLNSAEQLYLDYHATPTAANETAAQNAVNNVLTQQAALPLPTVTK